MNQKGLLTVWNDAKRFGFITPEDGGERVFAHISSYAGRGRRPVGARLAAYFAGFSIATLTITLVGCGLGSLMLKADSRFSCGVGGIAGAHLAAA